MELKLGLLVSLAALAVWPAASTAESPVAHAAAVCDYATQAEAQRAADTRDPDGDGIYCEDLPCPCSSAAVGDRNGGGGTKPEPAVDPGTSCARPKAVQRLVFSAHKYPNICKHFRAAVRRGWPESWSSIAEALTRAVTACCATSRLGLASTATNTRRPWVVARARASNAVVTLAAGRPTCATSPALRTAPTAPLSDPGSLASATEPGSGTSSAKRASAA